jgi:hypothetical protein
MMPEHERARQFALDTIQSFRDLELATPDLAPSERADLFVDLPEALQARCWDALVDVIEAERAASV